MQVLASENPEVGMCILWSTQACTYIITGSGVFLSTFECWVFILPCLLAHMLNPTMSPF
jgi:hypothetical protein